MTWRDEREIVYMETDSLDLCPPLQNVFLTGVQGATAAELSAVIKVFTPRQAAQLLPCPAEPWPGDCPEALETKAGFTLRSAGPAVIEC